MFTHSLQNLFSVCLVVISRSGALLYFRPLAVFSIPLSFTGPAFSLSTLTMNRICRRICMAVRTTIASITTEARADGIQQARNDLKMLRVNASSITTQVINLETWGNYSDQRFISKTVCTNRNRSPSESAVAFDVPMCAPNPTSIWPASRIHLRPEPFRFRPNLMKETSPRHSYILPHKATS